MKVFVFILFGAVQGQSSSSNAAVNNQVTFIINDDLIKNNPSQDLPKCRGQAESCGADATCRRPDIDFSGNDMFNAKWPRILTETWEGCACICHFTRGCEAWTWIGVGTITRNPGREHRCYLKHSSSKGTYRKHAVSGTRSC